MTTTIQAANDNLDSLYRQLDDAIEKSEQFVANREERIKRLRNLYSSALSPQQEYQHAFNLYKEFKPYMNDSALTYISRCVELARQMNNADQAALCTALLAFQYSTSGLYTESLEELHSLQPQVLSNETLAQYYVSMNHVYGELAYYSRNENKRQEYYRKADEYRDKVFPLLPEDDDIVLQYREINSSVNHRTDEALQISDRRLQHVDKNEHLYAIIAFYRSLDYQYAGDTLNQKLWLAESAICDVRNAVMDQGSLWELAQILQADGDMERAYRYIRFSWDCANRFHTRVRSNQITPVLSAIETRFQEQIVKSNRQLKLFTAVISVLSLLLLLSLFYVNRQRKRLHESNARLSEANNQLSTLNTKLSTLNTQLSTAISSLHESNRLKEEYIGRFLRLYSDYIDRIDAFRKQVNKRVKNHEYEQLYNETRSQERKEQDIDELYQNFDSAFLTLFPDFVQDFNALLRPDEQVQISDDGHLTTPLRIFALIRLGIDDSSKIAEFLHYSVNTIYNYRARVKNGAIADRDNFEKRVKEIGMPS